MSTKSTRIAPNLNYCWAICALFSKTSVSSLVETLKPEVIQALTSDHLFPIVLETFQLNLFLNGNGQVTDLTSFTLYVSRKAGFLSSMEKMTISSSRTMHLLRLQYLHEMFLHHTLTEKYLNAYFQYLNTNHKLIINDVFRKCRNFKTVFAKINSNNLGFLDLLIEYFDAIKDDEPRMCKTMSCMNKINFFELVRERFARVRHFCSDTCVILETNDRFDATIKAVGQFLTLLTNLVIKSSPYVLENLLSDTEKTINFRTLRQVVIFMLQTSSESLRSQATYFFEKILEQLNFKYLNDNDAYYEVSSERRKILAGVLRQLADDLILFNNLTFDGVIEILVKYRENQILALLNVDFSVFRHINFYLDLKSRKVQAQRFLRTLAHLVSICSFAEIEEQSDFRLIMEKVMSHKSRNSNMITAGIFQFLMAVNNAKVKSLRPGRYKSEPNAALIAGLTHTKMTGEVHIPSPDVLLTLN